MWPRSSKEGGALEEEAAAVREEEAAAAAEEAPVGEAVPREGVTAEQAVTYLGAPAALGVQRGPTDAATPVSRMGMAASSGFPVPPPRSPPWRLFGCSERAFASLISLDE